MRKQHGLLPAVAQGLIVEKLLQPLQLIIRLQTLSRRYLFYLLVLNSIVCAGLVVGIAPRALAPAFVLEDTVQQEWEQAATLSDLQQLHQRLQPQSTQATQRLSPSHRSRPWKFLPLLYQLQVRISTEKQASANLIKAQQLANQAARQLPPDHLSLAEIKQQEQLWWRALQQLAQIPPHSFVAEQVVQRTKTYERQYLQTAARADLLESDFLAAIAQRLPQPTQIMISICHLSGECRNYQGDRPPMNPASLIKLPIALTLIEQTNPGSALTAIPLLVTRGNHTENASGAKIRAGGTYSLAAIMTDMIATSNNVAANQLIDYLERPRINQTLQAQGYQSTAIHSKLMGNKIRPTNLGNRSNTTTTNDLTAMMRQIYANPKRYEALTTALAKPAARSYAFQALKNIQQAQWLGEKWGYNSQAMGTTAAVRIQGETYVIAIIVNRNHAPSVLHQGLQAVTQYILDQGHFRNPPPTEFDTTIEQSIDV